MKTIRTLISAAVIILFSYASGNAISLSFNPTSQNVAQGGIATVTVRIADLFTTTPNTAPSLSTFDFNVNFTSSILGFLDVTFGGNTALNFNDQLQLGAACNPASGFCGRVPGAGTVELFELSNQTVAALNSIQADAFILATLRFNALTGGTSTLTFSAPSGLPNIILGDASGTNQSATLGTGSITVSTPTPEPSSTLIFFLGALMLGMPRFLRRDNRKS